MSLLKRVEDDEGASPGEVESAYANGVLWNLLNMAIALWLLRRSAGYSPASPARAATSGTRSRSSSRS